MRDSVERIGGPEQPDPVRKCWNRPLAAVCFLLSVFYPAVAARAAGDLSTSHLAPPPLATAEPFAFRGAELAAELETVPGTASPGSARSGPFIPAGSLETAAAALAERFARAPSTYLGPTPPAQSPMGRSPSRTGAPTAPTRPSSRTASDDDVLTWKVARVLEAPNRIYVHLQQESDGRPILGARATCVFSSGGVPIEVKGRAFPGDLPRNEAGRNDGVGLAEGRRAALEDTGRSPEQVTWTRETEAWIVLEENGSSRLTPILRYEFIMESPHEALEAWVEATTGALLAREPLARDVEGTVEAEIEPETYGDTPARLPLGAAQVTLRAEGESVLSTQTTGADGTFRFESEPTRPYILRSELAGPRIRILDGNIGFTTPADSVPVTGASEASFLWNDSAASPSARDAFYHANVAYNFARTLDSGDALSPLDTPIKVRVDDPQGTCNAFWDGTGLTFYAAGGLCVATGRISDVVYHEYGHAVTTQIYRPFRIPRDMDEAFSDYFAATITNDARIGRGLYGQPGTYLRELETDRSWPEDANPTSPHQQGLILAGALWDLRAEIGAEAADPLFHFARYALPESFDEFLLDLLTYDDNDSDLTNGSPHFSSIIRAFRPHGIGDYSVAIEADALPDVEQPAASLEARARIRSLLGLETDELAFHYRISPEDGFTAIPLVPGDSSPEFVASFPSPPLGSTVEYWWSAVDTSGTTAVLPAGAPTNLLSFQVGPDLVAPDLEHEPLEFLTQDQVELPIEATVKDNSGRLAEVRIDYGMTGQVPPLQARLVDTGDGRFRTAIPVGPLPIGSSLEYRLTAVDASLAANSTRFPIDGSQILEVRRGSTESLEESDGGLSGQGDWEWGIPTGVPSPAHGTRVWATRLSGNYTLSSNSSLTWGPIAVEPGTPRRLQFSHWHDFVGGIDGGQIRISTNGVSWTPVSPTDGYGDELVSAFSDRAFTGQTDDWETVRVALDRFPGSQIWIRWEVRTSSAIGAPGWYIDDPQVVSAQERGSPYTFVASTGQSERVPLSWRAPRGIDTDAASFRGYRIYRAEGDAPFPAEPWATDIRSTQVIDRDVVNGVTYRYRLHAVYSEGESAGVDQVARPAAPVFGFPVAEMLFRLRGQSGSDTTLVVRNTGEGVLEFNAYLAESDQTIDDVRIRANLEGLGEEPVRLFEDPSDSPGPDIASVSVSRTQGVSGDVIHFEILGHRNWHDPMTEFGGLLLLDTDLDLGTGPNRSVFGWSEDLNIGWDVGILFGKISLDQGGGAPALIVHADDLNDLTPLSQVSLPEDSNRLTFSIPLSELGDTRALDISVLFANSRLSPPTDRAPNLPGLDWLRREPRKVRIRPGEERPFSLEFDAGELGNGDFAAQVLLTSNDPLVPQAVLPVRLEVSGIVPRDLDARSFRSLDDGMEIGFSTPRGLVATGALLERSQADANLWTVITETPLAPDEQGRFVLLDRTAQPRVTYDYRMRLLFQDLPGTYTFGPYPATYRPNAPTELALSLASSNPFRDRVDLRLEVPVAGRARIELFGVDGRRLATLLDEVVEPGRYPVSWMTSPGRGIYWARAEVSGVGSRVLRLVQIR